MTAYAIARDLERRLKERRFPIPVLYGPERTKRARFANAIVFERDRKTSDQIGPALGAKMNPPMFAVRGLAALVTIWSKSEAPAARLSEHEELCEQVVDAVFLAVQDVVRESQRILPQWTSLAYTTPEDLGVQEQWPGVVYAMRFTVPRGVYQVTYLGAGLPEGTVSGNALETQLLRNATDPPETVP